MARHAVAPAPLESLIAADGGQCELVAKPGQLGRQRPKRPGSIAEGLACQALARSASNSSSRRGVWGPAGMPTQRSSVAMRGATSAPLPPSARCSAARNQGPSETLGTSTVSARRSRAGRPQRAPNSSSREAAASHQRPSSGALAVSHVTAIGLPESGQAARKVLTYALSTPVVSA